MKSYANMSEFIIPVNLQASRFNGQQLFLKSLIKQKGVWVKFKLGGHIFSPEVAAKAVFLSLEPYCKAQPLICNGMGVN